MGKTVFLISNEEFIPLIQNVAAEFPGVVDEVRYQDPHLSPAESAGKYIEGGADIIIARGYQALDIRAGCSVPLVELRMTGQEIASLIVKAKAMCSMPHPRIYLLGAPNMYGDISEFGRIFDVELTQYSCETSMELGSDAVGAISAGADPIIGGQYDVEYASRLGVPAVYYSLTAESVRAAIKEAATVRSAINMIREYDSRIDSLMHGAFNGFILFDKNGTAQRCNTNAEQMLGTFGRSIVGKSFCQLLPNLKYGKFEDVLRTGETLSDFTNIRGQGYAVILRPIVTDSAPDGVLVSFRAMGRSLERWDGAARRSRISFSSIKAVSPAMRRAVSTGNLFCLTSHPVLLSAEPGIDALTFARCIHHGSDCSSGGSFIPVDCSLWSSGEEQADYLFGFGPRTLGDTDPSLGAVGSAGEGTLFIDGIELLSPSVQARVFHAAKYHSIVYSSADRSVPINTRLIARTFLPLEELAARGLVIPGLYHLLAPMSVVIPPLRQTGEDLVNYAASYFEQLCSKYSRFLHLSDAALEELRSCQWPGNYAQLESFLERVVLSAPENTINGDFIHTLYQLSYPAPAPDGGADDSLPDTEEKRILGALFKHGGDRKAAAAQLGMSTTTLWRRMKKYNIASKF